MKFFRLQAIETQLAMIIPAWNKTVAISIISSSEYVEKVLTNLDLWFCFFLGVNLLVGTESGLMLLDRSGQGKVYPLINRRRFQQMDVLEGLNVLVTISGKVNIIFFLHVTGYGRKIFLAVCVLGGNFWLKSLGFPSFHLWVCSLFLQVNSFPHNTHACFSLSSLLWGDL